jgi:hypothetical protein
VDRSFKDLANRGPGESCSGTMVRSTNRITSASDWTRRSARILLTTIKSAGPNSLPWWRSTNNGQGAFGTLAVSGIVEFLRSYNVNQTGRSL